MKKTQLLSKLRSSNYNSIAYNHSYYNVYTQNAQTLQAVPVVGKTSVSHHLPGNG